MYGFTQTQSFSPRACSRSIMPAGSGNWRLSHAKSHQWNSSIQKQSKWNTDRGISRAAIPSMKEVTVASS